MTKSKLFSKCQVLYLCFLLHKFLKTLDFSKCQVLDLVIFALIFSEFGYVPRKSWGHRKNLEHSQIQKKSKANMTKSKTCHLEKIYTWTRLIRIKIARKLKFYVKIIISGSKSVKKGQIMPKKATNWTYNAFPKKELSWLI